MLYVLALILSVLSLFLIKNKFMTMLWFVYFLILFGFNNFNPDYGSYKNIYRLFQQKVYDGKLADKGYIVLMQVSQKFHLSFEQFFIVIAFFTLLLLFYTINKFSDYRNLVFIPLLIYPFTLSIVQTRFFLSTSIVLLGLTMLQKGTKQSKLLFLITLTVATLIHFSSILYVIYFLATMRSFRRIYCYLFIGLIGMFLIINGVELINLKVLSQGIQKYFISALEFRGLVFVSRVIFFRLAIVVSVHLLLKYFRHLFSERDIFLAKITNITMLVTMLFEIVNTEFERFSRIGFIVLYILIFNVFGKLKLPSNKIILFSISIVFFVSYVGYQYFLRESNGQLFFDAVFKDIFENNSLINYSN